MSLHLFVCVCLETLKAVAFPNSTSSLDVPSSSNTIRFCVDVFGMLALQELLLGQRCKS
jgi:hypothetical protein